MRKWIVIAVSAVVALGAYVERDRLKPFLPGWVASASSETGNGASQAQNGAAQDGSSGGGQKAGSGGGARKQVATVSVVQARSGSLPVLRETIGTVVPLASTALGTPTSGTVVEVNARDGARVKAGDLLARLDDRTIKANIERDKAAVTRDQATLDNALATLQRTQNLLKTGVATKQAGDDAQAAVNVAKASIAVDQAVLDGDQVTLAQTEIRAPFDGKLGAVTLSPGAYVAPGTSVVMITQMKPVYAEFSLPETDLDLTRTALKAGKLSVEVTPVLASDTTKTATGPIVFIDNAVDQATATFKLRAKLDNDEEALWPGQSLHVTVKAGEKSGLVIVPNVAVQPQDSGSVAYVVKPDKTIEVRKVNVALRDDQNAGIDQGLKEGETVVTEGQATLANGATVKIADNKAAAPRTGGTAVPKPDSGDAARPDAGASSKPDETSAVKPESVSAATEKAAVQ